MTPADQLPAPAGSDLDVPLRFETPRNRADTIYRAVARASAIAVLMVMGLIFVFLAYQSWPALRSAKLSFLTERQFNPGTGRFGIAAVLVGTIVIALTALAIAVPLSIGAALFLTEYAPRKVRKPLTSLVDLLAAVPSLIYGLWGYQFLMPKMLGLSRWLASHFGWIPLLRNRTSNFANSAFIAGVVVAIMVVPICTAVMREVFSLAPPGEKEGALALGGTRWGVVRTVVLPFGKGGIIGGSMLGLGRALGETIAVALIISTTFDHPISMLRVLDNGGNSIAALIALRWSESIGLGLRALIAAGLVLFVMTLAVNAVASSIVSRSRSGSATEI